MGIPLISEHCIWGPKYEVWPHDQQSKSKKLQPDKWNDPAIYDADRNFRRSHAFDVEQGISKWRR